MEMLRFCLLMMLCLGQHRSFSDILKRQKRNWIIDSFAIEEENKGPFPYSLGKIQVETMFTYFKLEGEGVDKEPKNILSIDTETGVILVHGSVDREKYAVLKLAFKSLDKGSHAIDTQLGVEVTILDINDNHPTFDRNKYEISVKESASQGTDLVTVKAHDADSLQANREFDLRILSVTPTPSDLEFNLKAFRETGTIHFNGCLDHEKAEKYIIILEAKDHGEKIQLSSTCEVILTIEDGNNHLPIFTGQTGPGRVKEGEENVLVLRLQVTDKDSKGTEAWRAIYKIHGDTNNNFIITTDPVTNEGLLFLEKYLDYEEDSEMNLSISVENEIPYQSCEVQRRNTNGAWDVVKIAGEPGRGQVPPLSSRHVTVTVEDVNEPPFFTPSVKDVMVMENVAVGHYLETFTARDLDIKSASHFKYTKGEDPGDWVTVDPKTGKMTTSKLLDRESSFVKNNVYKVILYAVDSELPPMTGTATLNIHINDVNDNAPSLVVNIMDMCLSDGPSLANITAFDLDEVPYSGPFRFKLHGDVEGKWRIDPSYGYSVSLVKENTVYAGHHDLLLEVSDLQDNSASHNLSVTVCECSDTRRPNCRTRKATSSSVGGGAFGMMFVAALLLAGVLLLALLLSCKKKSKDIPDEDSGEHLMKCNTEKIGTDCEVVLHSLNPGNSGNVVIDSITTRLSLRKSSSLRSSKSFYTNKDLYRGAAEYQHRNSKYKTWTVQREYPEWQQNHVTTDGIMLSMLDKIRTVRREYPEWQQNHVNTHGIVLSMLDKTMCTLQAPGEELGDYAPHSYNDEGHSGTNTVLDAISITDIPFELDMDLDLKFKKLASICMLDPSTA